MIAFCPIPLAGHSVYAQGKGKHCGVAGHHRRDIVLLEDILQAIHQALTTLGDRFEDRLGFQQAQSRICPCDSRLIVGVRPTLRHALPNAWAPIVTVIAFNLAYLVVGVVVVEVVFVYPGIGQLMVDAVRSRDIPVVQACALIFAATYILLNLTADILSILANPRLRHPR